MTAALPTILVASLLGSGHCAAMCGGFVCFYASDARELRAHVLYNIGRLISYVSLGLVAGAVGSGVAHAGAVVGVGRIAAILGGLLMVLWGTARLASAFGGRAFAPGISSAIAARMQRTIGRALGALRDRGTGARALAMGLFTTLLPCGWLYVFVAAAAATGSPFEGAVAMTAFWLGTLPAMLAVGFGAQRIFGSFRKTLPLASAVVVVIIGVLTMTGRLAMNAGISHGH
jgi:uncharacterized protein